MKRNFMISAFLMLIFPVFVSAQIASGGAFSLEKSVIGAGGESAGGSFSLTGTSGQNAAGTTANNMAFIQKGGFWTPDDLLLTAAVVTIGGRVRTPDERGIRNVRVTLTDTSGATRSVFTGASGLYSFTDVEVGQTYVLTVFSKKFTFALPSQVVAVNEEVDDLDFIAECPDPLTCNGGG